MKDVLSSQETIRVSPFVSIKLEFELNLRLVLLKVSQQPSPIPHNARLGLANDWNRRACPVIKQAFGV